MIRVTHAGATAPCGPIVLQLGTEVDDAIALDFERWCEDHLRDNLRLPGFLSGRRLRRSTTSPPNATSPASLTLYQLEAASALETPEYAGRRVSMPAHFANRLRFERALYRALDEPDGVAALPVGRAILHVAIDVEPQWRDRFVEWYATVHVPAVLEAPGMLAARRFEHVELTRGSALPPGQHPYCALYEMEATDLLTRPETLAAAARGACPPDLAAHRVSTSQVYEEVFRVDASRPDD
ncbi:MAG: DUF4286 family protein [Myxococcota bacterium]